MELNPDGVFSVGLKIGRCSADLVLLDLTGQVRNQIDVTCRYPLPDEVFGFLENGLDELLAGLPAEMRGLVRGIGPGTPFELWERHDPAGLAADKFRAWKNVGLAAEVARFTDLPVCVVNDATAACLAELLYGRGREFYDYADFFIGSLIGGGVALNGTVFEGNRGNAGAVRPNARGIVAAGAPIFRQFLLDANAGLAGL